MKLPSLILTASLAALLASTARAEGFAGLKTELNAAAEDVSRFLKEEGRTDVALSDFIAPPILQVNFGNEIKREFKAALESQKLTVSDHATYAVAGRYRIAADSPDNKNSGMTGIVIEVDVSEQASGKIPHKLQRMVFDNSALAAATGSNGTLIPGGKPETRNEEIVKSLDKPKFTISGSKVLVQNAEHPNFGQFGLEIGVVKGVSDPHSLATLSDAAFEPRTPALRNEKDEKNPFVELNHDEIYAVRLINNSNFDAAVQLSVDGLNVFSFSDVKGTDGNPFTHWIVRAHSTGIIPGWHKNHSESLRFKITDLPNSAAFKAKSTGNIGVINALFSAVLKGGQNNATDESARGADVATGFGPPVEFKTEPVAVTMGAVRATVSIRYGK